MFQDLLPGFCILADLLSRYFQAFCFFGTCMACVSVICSANPVSQVFICRGGDWSHGVSVYILLDFFDGVCRRAGSVIVV